MVVQFIGRRRTGCAIFVASDDVDFVPRDRHDPVVKPFDDLFG